MTIRLAKVLISKIEANTRVGVTCGGLGYERWTNAYWFMKGAGGGFRSPRDLEYKDGASKKVGV